MYVPIWLPGTKYSDKIDIKEIEADIRTVYKEVSELPDNTEVNQKSKNSYMDKLLPNGKTVRQLAKAMAKEGIVSGVATGMVYMANGEDFVDGFVNGTVSGVLSSGVSGVSNKYRYLIAGEVLGESVEFIMNSYVHENIIPQEEKINELTKNTAFIMFRCVSKSGIRAIITEADKEMSIARQFMEYDEKLGANLELFWGQLIDILTSLEEDESGE